MMDEDFMKADELVCLPTSDDNEHLDNSKKQIDDDEAACLDSTEQKLNCDVNGHDTVCLDQMDGNTHGDHLDAEVEGDTQDDHTDHEIDGDKHDDHTEAQEDGDTYGNRLDAEVDGDTHGDHTDVEIDGNKHDDHTEAQEDGDTYGDRLDAEVDSDTHGDHTDVEIDGDKHGDHTDVEIEANTHGDHMNHEVGVDTQGNHTDAQEDGETYDHRLDAEIDGDHTYHEIDGDKHGDHTEAQEDGDTHGDLLDAEVDGDTFGDRLDAEVDGDTHGDHTDVEIEANTHGDHMNHEVGVDTQGNHTDAQEDGETYDHRLDAEEDGDLSDAEKDSVVQGDCMDVQDDGNTGIHSSSEDDPPFSSLTCVETKVDLSDEDEKDNKLSDDNISADSSASMLEDPDEIEDQGEEAELNTPFAEEDTAVDGLTSERSDGTEEIHDMMEGVELGTSEVPTEGETNAEKYKDNMNLNDINLTGQKNVEDDNELGDEIVDKVDAGEVNQNTQGDSENRIEANIPNVSSLNEANSLCGSTMVVEGAAENDLKKPNDEVEVDTIVESTSSHDKTVPSNNKNNSESVLNSCSEVDETKDLSTKENIDQVEADVDNRKEEDVEEMVVDEEKYIDVKEQTTTVDKSESLKPELPSSGSKESDIKHFTTTKVSELGKQANDDVICLISSDEEASETSLSKAKSSADSVDQAQPSLNGQNSNLSNASNEGASKSSDHQENSTVEGSDSKGKVTKETNPSSAAADEEEDIMVIEEASSAPARKPARTKVTVDNPSAVKRCKLCKKTFNSSDWLRKHVREAHGLIMIDKEQILRCRICSFRGVWSVFVKHLSEKHPSASHLIKDVDSNKHSASTSNSVKQGGRHNAPDSKKIGGANVHKIDDASTSEQESIAKSPYSLRPRKASVVHSTTKESLLKNDSSVVSSVSSTSQMTYSTKTPKGETSYTEPNDSMSAEGVKKQKAFFEKIVADGFTTGKRQIRLDILLKNCDKTIFECAICQQSFPDYLQVYFHQKVCLPTPERPNRIIVYLPFETIMSQFVYSKVGIKRFLQCIHCSNRVNAMNVSAVIQALHLSIHVVPEVTIRTYYNGVISNRIGHARQDSNKKAFSWDQVLKPVSVNRTSVVSSLNNNLDRYICTSGRLHQMESRHVLNDDLHDFGRIHSSSSDEESEQWETTYRRRKHSKKKKKIEFLSPNSKQKQSLLASVRYRLTSKREHEREQRMAKRDERKRKRDMKNDGSDSDYEIKKPTPSIQKLSFGIDSKCPPITKSNGTSPSILSEKITSSKFPMQNTAPKTRLASLLTSAQFQPQDESVAAQNEFGTTSPSLHPQQHKLSPDVQANHKTYPEHGDDEPECLPENDFEDEPDCLPENNLDDNSSEELPTQGSLSNQEVQAEPLQEPEEPEEDLGPLLTEEDLAEYWRLFEEDETIPTEDGQCETSAKLIVPATDTAASLSISSLLSSLPTENDIQDYYGGSKQPVSSKMVVFMTTQHVFKYFTLMPMGTSSANFVCCLRGCTAVYSVTSHMAAHLGSHFPIRVIVQDYPSTSVGQVVPLLTTKQVLQHYRSRQTANDERFRYSCCFKRCNASTLLDQSLSIHLTKHFSYICTGNILLRKAEFVGHPLLSHYNCLRGAKRDHSCIFQLTCKKCNFFVTTYIFKGKVGDIVEAELSAHALSHDVGTEAEEALRKMCRATSNKLSSDKVFFPKPASIPQPRKPQPATASVSEPRKPQPATSDVRRTVSVTEPELLKKFGATTNGWRCLVKHCGFLHRGVKDLFIFANHLRRHILGCKKIIVMKKKTPTSSTPNRMPQDSSNSTATKDKPEPIIDVVTIDDTSDDENKTSKAPISGNEEKRDIKSSCNIKVVLNKIPLSVAIDKIEAMKASAKTNINNADGKSVSAEQHTVERKIDDDEKSEQESANKDEKSYSAVSVNGEPVNGSNEKEASSTSKRKREEPVKTGSRKSLRLSEAVDEDVVQDSKSNSKSESGDAKEDDIADDAQEEEMTSKDQPQDQNNDVKDLANLSMEKLISELKSTKSDPIILPITTVEGFFKQEIQSNLNRSSAVVGTMNFTCLMCDKAGFKGKDFELVRHLESHIGKKISLKMKELQVKDSMKTKELQVKDIKEDDTGSPKKRSKSKFSRSLVHHDIEDLRKCPQDRLQMRFQEVENFFVKNVRLSRSKSEFSFGVLMYTCVECNVGDLKTEHLVKHLEDHVEKTIKLIRNPAKTNGPSQ